MSFDVPVISPTFKKNAFRESPLGKLQGKSGLFQPVVNREIHSSIIVEKEERNKGKRPVKERIFLREGVDYTFIVLYIAL
jgi:hypothetical protein